MIDATMAAKISIKKQHQLGKRVIKDMDKEIIRAASQGSREAVINYPLSIQFSEQTVDAIKDTLRENGYEVKKYVNNQFEVKW